MTRFLLALRAAFAALVAWLRYSPSRQFRIEAKANLDTMARELGPYRKAAKLESDAPIAWGAGPDQLFDDVLEELEKQEAEDTWTQAQRDITPADLRAVEARRQNVIVEPPYTPTKIRE